MRLVGRALGDPLPQNRNLIGRELLVRFRGRHLLLGVGGGEALERFALFGLAGDERIAAIRLGDIKSQFRLARLFVGAVALETVVRENRPYVAVEIDPRWRRARPAAPTERPKRNGRKGVTGEL